MTLSIGLSALSSRLTRIATELNGTRRFVTSVLTTPITRGGLTKVFGGFASALKGYLIGSAVSAMIQAATMSFSSMWGMVVAAKQTLWNFNWNATDQSLDANIKASFNALGSQLGATVGGSLGFLVCGALPGSSMIKLNEPLALHAMEELKEEFSEEVGANISLLIRQTGWLASQAALTFMYKNARNLYNEASEKFKKSFGLSFPGAKAASDKSNQEPWSFAMATENAIEKIPNEFMRNFIEEGLEEFDETCTEAGYILATGIDSYLASEREARRAASLPDETITILLNR